LGGRLYYSWVVVLACNLVACITWGVAIFNQGVFAAYWIREYGWSPATLALAPTLFQLWAGVAGVFVGRSVDRWGPKPALLVGAFFLCLSLAAVAHLEAAWQAIPAFLVMGTGFACIHTVTLGKIVARWFLAQRTRAMAAATLGAGFGGAALTPPERGPDRGSWRLGRLRRAWGRHPRRAGPDGALGHQGRAGEHGPRNR